MLTEPQRQRFSVLRQQEEMGTLNASEREELNRLIEIIEGKEQEMLRPAMERMHQEHLRIQAQNAALKTLIGRQERLTCRLERVLAFAQNESAAISARLSEILHPLTAETTTPECR